MEKEFLKQLHDHQKIISRICRMYRDTSHDQEDLFQEITYQLWRSWPAFRGESKLSTWIYRIALNTSLTTYRRKKPELHYYEELGEKMHPPADEETSENKERLFHALRTLNDSEKAVISLFLEDYSYEEIAHITGITLSNVGVKLNRIKAKLKTLLNQTK